MNRIAAAFALAWLFVCGGTAAAQCHGGYAPRAAYAPVAYSYPTYQQNKVVVKQETVVLTPAAVFLPGPPTTRVTIVNQTTVVENPGQQAVVITK